jgi:hypothetical protein
MCVEVQLTFFVVAPVAVVTLITVLVVFLPTDAVAPTKLLT